jgi:hypothetical protein
MKPNNLLEAKHSIKENIKFFQMLLEHLKGPDKALRGRAIIAAWCVHRYMNDKLLDDVEKAMLMVTPKEGANVQ